MIRTQAAMGTIVSIEVDAPAHVVTRAFEWFQQVEAVCSRFDPDSELRRLVVGEATPASPILFEAVSFALKVAHATDGAFDPTLGSRMAARGYNRHYATMLATDAPGVDDSSFRDVVLDATHHTILLKRPLTLDLGAVAKGLAVDAATRELQPFHDFCIDAGGDIYFGGRNPAGKPWSVGVRHPHRRDEIVARLQVADCAVCTSGNYERGPHILDPRNAATASRVASATVIAPNTMLADALATAAFVLGPEQGIALLEHMGVQGLLITPALEQHCTL
ncbi:MAG: FAD:protein FMN transferase, partial [Steroidobacteraceae bacterium]